MAKFDPDQPPLITFDDVLLEPQFSDVEPMAPSLKTKLTEDIELEIPIISSPMDTVTGKEMCIAMAQLGGIGILHRNYDLNEQIQIVKEVKHHEAYLIDAITIEPNMTVGEVREIAKDLPFNSFPVIDNQGYVLGVLTHTDYYLDSDSDPVSERMSKDIVTISRKDSEDREKVKDMLRRKKKKQLLVTDKDGRLEGIITGKDFLLRDQYQNATRDKEDRLRVGAAIGVGEKEIKRAGMLYDAGVDVVVIDISHGHCQNEIDTIKEIKKQYPDLPIIGGNVATAKGVEDLADAGADCVRIGIGAGSICTTRKVLGSGKPQLSAVIECAEKAEKLGIYSIADGGIKEYGHMAIALAYADTVMVGSLLAGVEESPGRRITVGGKTFKEYYGMGSLKAQEARAGGGRSRYESKDEQEAISQGVEGRVDYKGPLNNVLYQMTGAIRHSLAMSGANDLKEFRKKSIINLISKSGAQESHPSVEMTEQPPNYMRNA